MCESDVFINAWFTEYMTEPKPPDSAPGRAMIPEVTNEGCMLCASEPSAGGVAAVGNVAV